MRSTVRYLKSNNTTIEVTNTQLRVALLREYAFSITLRFCLSIFENKSKQPTYAQLVRGMGGQRSKNPSKLTQNTPRAGKQTAANIEAKCKFAIFLWEFKEISAPSCPADQP